jgi:hypothetical protein
LNTNLDGGKVNEPSDSKELVVANKNVREVTTLLLIYAWPVEAISLIKNGPIPEFDEFGNPDDNELAGLQEMATHCRDLKLEPEEALAMLQHLIKKWKFSIDRWDEESILEVITEVGAYRPSGSELVASLKTSGELVELSKRTKLYNYVELMNAEIVIEWVMEYILTKQGIIAFSGPPGVGKTQIVFQWCIALGTGKAFLEHQILDGIPRRILVFSLEMTESEIKHFLGLMDQRLTPAERELLEENLIFYPLGTSLYLNSPADREEYWRIIKEVKPDGIIIDSWSMAVMGDLSSDTNTRDAFAFVNAVRAQFGCFFGIINHTKKKQGDNVPNTMDDIFGSRFFSAALSSAIVVWPHKGSTDKIELHFVKNRFSQRLEKPIVVQRTPDLEFILEFESLSMLTKLRLDGSQRQRKREIQGKALKELMGFGDEFKFVVPLEEDDMPETFIEAEEILKRKSDDGNPLPGFEL